MRESPNLLPLALLLLSYTIGGLPIGRIIIEKRGLRSTAEARIASPYNLGLESAAKRVGWGPLVIAFLIDIFKGYLGVFLLAGYGLPWALLAAVLVYLGHLYPLPIQRKRSSLRARGGGILLGVLAGLSVGGLGTLYALVPVALALVVYAATGYATLAALSLALALALVASFLPLDPLSKGLAWVLFLLALWRYKENLGRILEGTEPKLGEPLPLPDEKTAVCAFLIHPLTLEDFWQSPRFKLLRPLVKYNILRASWVEKMAKLFRPMKVGEIRGVKTADGREIRCHLISAPLLPEQIVSHPDLALKRAIQGARLAEELGATVVGLGAFWSVVGEKGKEVQKAVPGITVTNGGALTSATAKAIVPSALDQFREKHGNGKRITAGVVGMPGVVAFGVARFIAPQVQKIILVGRPNGDRKRVERAAETLRRNLERKGKTTEVVVADNLNALKEADLIFTATSDPEPVIFPTHVKKGAWVIDKGVPPDTHPDVRRVQGVKVIQGGVVRLPGPASSTLDLHFGGKNQVPACLAETMVLSAIDGEQRERRKTLGREVLNENGEFFLAEARKLGFEVLGPWDADPPPCPNPGPRATADTFSRGEQVASSP